MNRKRTRDPFNIGLNLPDVTADAYRGGLGYPPPDYPGQVTGDPLSYSTPGEHRDTTLEEAMKRSLEQSREEADVREALERSREDVALAATLEASRRGAPTGAESRRVRGLLLPPQQRGGSRTGTAASTASTAGAATTALHTSRKQQRVAYQDIESWARVKPTVNPSMRYLFEPSPDNSRPPEPSPSPVREALQHLLQQWSPWVARMDRETLEELRRQATFTQLDSPQTRELTLRIGHARTAAPETTPLFLWVRFIVMCAFHSTLRALANSELEFDDEYMSRVFAVYARGDAFARHQPVFMLLHLLLSRTFFMCGRSDDPWFGTLHSRRIQALHTQGEQSMM